MLLTFLLITEILIFILNEKKNPTEIHKVSFFDKDFEAFYFARVNHTKTHFLSSKLHQN